MTQTIAQIHARFLPLIGNEYTLPVTANKGLPGTFLEGLLGIPHTPNCLDCSDGELKTIPVKESGGTFVPKETIAVTMLSREALQADDFNSSRCCIKMSKMLVVPYYRTGDTIRFMTPTIISRECSEFAELYRILENDYNQIRRDFIDHNNLSSRTGILLQNRTKGRGHGSTTRAFYLRKEFVSRYVPLN